MKRMLLAGAALAAAACASAPTPAVPVATAPLAAPAPPVATPPAPAPLPAGLKRGADGHPDFTGTWQTDGGVTFIASAKDEKGNICVINCGPSAKSQAATGEKTLPPPPRTFPKYKPEYLAKVDELKKNQVKEDPALKCGNPGVPRIGPPMKIVQNAKEVVFLYDDLNGAFWRIIPFAEKVRDDG
jgi:hypothetical protein